MSSASRVDGLTRRRVPECGDGYLQLHRNTSPLGYGSAERMVLLHAFDNIELHRYPDIEILQTKIAGFVAKSEHNINITSGIDGAIRDVIDIFCQRGDRIAYLTPCYMMYKIYGKAYNLESVEISCSEALDYDFEQIIDVISATKPRIFFLTNPHSPVDFSLSKMQFKELLYATERSGTLIFVDEAYHFFGAESFIDFVDSYDHLIVGRTFSKAFGLPSIRIGFLHSSDRIAALISARRLAYETNTLSAQIAIAAIDNFTIVQNHIDGIINGRNYVKSGLSDKGYSTHGNNLNSLVVTDLLGQSAELFLSELEKANIAVRCLPNPFSHLINFTVGPKNTMDTLLEFF